MGAAPPPPLIPVTLVRASIRAYIRRGNRAYPFLAPRPVRIDVRY